LSSIFLRKFDVELVT